MKTCYRCKKEKSKKLFHKSAQKKDGLSHLCKGCRAKYDRKYWLERTPKMKARFKKTQKKRVDKIRLWLFDYLKDKSFSLSNVGSLFVSFELAKLEIKKCQILCANCHRRVTAKQFGYYKYRLSRGVRK